MPLEIQAFSAACSGFEFESNFSANHSLFTQCVKTSTSIFNPEFLARTPFKNPLFYYLFKEFRLDLSQKFKGGL
jgi:hypothetical protein